MANSPLLGAVILAGTAIAALSTSAQAQPFRGIYIGAGAGYNLTEDINVKTPTATNPRTQLQTNGGLVGLGSVGYGFGNGFRVELEGNYRDTGISGMTNQGAASTSGTLRTYGVMANVLFDMDVGCAWMYPYIGGGAGYAWSDLQNLTTTPPGSRTEGTQGRFAVQAIAGLSFPVYGVPGLSISSEYRFMGLLGNASYNTNTSGTVTRLTLQHQYNHGFLLGVRYAFGVTPPVMPAAASTPAPAVQPSRSYLVFFDWDKATLTDRARAIIKDAADNSTKVQYTRIEVNGYTDTSGTKQYNQGLSVRRAEAVAAELVKNGVPRNAITATGYGDTKLLVATGPGVREAQNRRVEIVLR